MKNITQDHLAKFAGLVAKCWNDETLHRSYRADPVKVLAHHGITLPEGVPAPLIPPLPEVGPATGLLAVPLAFRDLTFDNWDLTIQDLPGGTSAGVRPRLGVSSLACAACPVSSFSSLSN